MLQQFLRTGSIISLILAGANLFAFCIDLTLSALMRSASIYGFVFIGWFLCFGLLGLGLFGAWGIREDWQTHA